MTEIFFTPSHTFSSQIIHILVNFVDKQMTTEKSSHCVYLRFQQLSSCVQLIRLPPRTIAWTISSELLGFCFHFLVSVPCARL